MEPVPVAVLAIYFIILLFSFFRIKSWTKRLMIAVVLSVGVLAMFVLGGNKISLSALGW